MLHFYRPYEIFNTKMFYWEIFVYDCKAVVKANRLVSMRIPSNCALKMIQKSALNTIIHVLSQ